MLTYPICVVGLEKKVCVVIGGGQVAERKVQALLEAGAGPVVVSPAITAELQARVEAGRVKWVPRGFQAGDLEGVFLVVAASADAAVNRAVWQEAQARGCLINVVDDPEHCNFILPAVVRRGALTVAVSTGGSSPALARRLRERLEGELGPEYAELVSLLAELRPELLGRLPPGRPRLEAALRVLDSGVLDVLRAEGRAAGLAHARAELGSAARLTDEAA